MENNSTDIPISNSRHHVAVVSSSSQGAREYQEDACGHWSDTAATRLFAVVADGAGGHGGGAEASRAAIAAAAQTWEKCPASDLADPGAFLAKWMAYAHRAVIDESARIRRSARAVVVACLTDGRAVHWVHAGDCRLLRFHEGKFVERTRDDSVVQVLLERGDITEEAMGTHPDQSRLLQSLGGEDPPSPRPGKAEVVAGDTLILCSDGFWEHLKRDELEELATVPPARRQRALDQAVAKAVRRGGQKADNTTALMITFGDTKGAGSRPGIAWVLLVLAALAAGAAAGWWSARPENLEWLKQKIKHPISQSGAAFSPHRLAPGKMPGPPVARASCGAGILPAASCSLVPGSPKQTVLGILAGSN